MSEVKKAEIGKKQHLRDSKKVERLKNVQFEYHRGDPCIIFKTHGEPQKVMNFAHFLNGHDEIRLDGMGERIRVRCTEQNFAEILDEIATWDDATKYSDYFDQLKVERTSFQERVEKILTHIRNRGQIQFEDINILLKKDVKVLLKTGFDTVEGGVVVDLYRQTSFMGGQYWTIRVNQIEYDGGKYHEQTHHYSIHEYNGYMNITDLPVRPVNDEEMISLEERGKKFMTYANNASYVYCEGYMYRKSWLGINKWNSEGRVMIDNESFGKFDSNYGRGYRDDEHGTEVSKDMIFALPSTVKGYSMRIKYWGEFRVDDLRPIEFRENAFDLLVMDNTKKKLVRALVENKATFRDLISGKGGGTIFLLYGPPGTGKTLTAETVSEFLKRPLYMVSVGELGTTANELEARLRDILELATTWNAILLIDEADIFLEKRTTNNIERNAMVGIFLRLLEYYSGVLFMTTNRAETLDEAFLSRISLAMHYDKHDEKTRMKIWISLLSEQGIKLDSQDLEKLAVYELNGRQIKNMIKMAMTLVASDGGRVTIEVIEEIIKHQKLETKKS
jgi:hypothetical protein